MKIDCLEFGCIEQVCMYIDEGISVIPVEQNGKRPLIRWKKYQYKMPDFSQYKTWLEKYGDFNLGMITGKSSRCVVIDVDDMSKLSDLKNGMPELENTTSYETNRGLHFCFKTTVPIATCKNFMDIEGVELLGDGHLAVVPYSVIDGVKRKFMVPLSNMKFFPLELLKAAKTKQSFYLPNRCATKGASCIRQIAARDLIETERDDALHVFYNLLVQNGNQEEFAQNIIKHKNKRLSEPLSHSDLKDTWGNSNYQYSCQKVREKLPYIKCEGCRYMEMHLRSKGSVLSQFHSELPGLKPGQVKVLTVIDTYFEGRLPNPTKLSSVAGADIRTVNRAIKELKLDIKLSPYE